MDSGTSRGSGRNPNFPLENPSSNDSLIPSALSIVLVNYHISRNGFDHRTLNYEVMRREKNPCLVVRRGQTFKMTLTFNRPFNSEIDEIYFVFSLKDEKEPSIARGTMLPLRLLVEKPYPTDKEWKVLYSKYDNMSIIVDVYPSSNSFIGVWNLKIGIKTKQRNELIYESITPIYILFNPWSSDDQVFLTSKAARHEFVEMEYGIIYRDNDIATLWNFCQFEKDVLDCALYLLKNVGKIRISDMGDPVEVSRVLSSVVNNKNKNGVVKGCWENLCNDGIHPYMWKSSLKILQNYYETKQSVKYGQCWVFAGVLTTLCRTLGLPCRPVTVCNVAHDTNGSLALEIEIDNDENEKSIERLWRFHVWNEVWMKRPNLNSKHDGWQILDGTPQENPNGFSNLGPVSVTAIKEGETLFQPDSQYIHSKIYSEIIRVKKNNLGVKKFLEVDPRKLCTKAMVKTIGINFCRDITFNYKEPSNHIDEYNFGYSNLQQYGTSFSRFDINEKIEQITFDFILRENYVIGEDFTVIGFIRNSSENNNRDVKGCVHISLYNYMGKLQKTIKKYSFYVTVPSQNAEKFEIDVTFPEYRHFQLLQYYFKVTCLFKVVNTNYEKYVVYEFQLAIPEIAISVNGRAVVGVPLQVILRFENTFPITLTSGEFHIDAFNTSHEILSRLSMPVHSGEYAIAVVELIPTRLGVQSISATFTSKEITGITGYRFIPV